MVSPTGTDVYSNWAWRCRQTSSTPRFCEAVKGTAVALRPLWFFYILSKLFQQSYLIKSSNSLLSKPSWLPWRKFFMILTQFFGALCSMFPGSMFQTDDKLARKDSGEFDNLHWLVPRILKFKEALSFTVLILHLCILTGYFLGHKQMNRSCRFRPMKTKLF